MKLLRLALIGSGAALFAWAGAANADYKAGMDALAVKDYARARAEFETEPNNGEAIYQMSRLAAEGWGEPKNPARVAGLLERAAKAGHASAAVDYAFVLGNGRGVPKDGARAVTVLEEAIARSNTEAVVTLAKAFNFGWWDVEKNGPRAATLARQAVQAGDPAAKALLGLMLVEGTAVPKDEAQGVLLLRQAAEEGDLGGMVETARLYLRGDAGVAKDMAAGLEWYRKAADRGSRAAQYGIALAYINGWGVPVDLDAGARWADAAARQGDGWAQFTLARAYESGSGVPRIRAEAYYWYSVAANSTSAAAAARANERRVALAREMKQEDIDSLVRRASAFQPEPGFRPRAAALPVPSRGSSVMVGTVKIEMPSLRGFANDWQTVEYLQRAKPNDPTLRPVLMVLSRQEDIDRTKLGLSGPYRCIEVMQYEADPAVKITPALFAEMKKRLRDTVDNSVRIGRYKVEQSLRDDDTTLALLRSSVSQPNRLDGLMLVLVKERVLWVSFTGFSNEHATELAELLRTTGAEMVAANRGLFGG